MTNNNIANIEYVLRLGTPDANGGLTGRCWHEFVNWIWQLADCVVIWTACSRADVGRWVGATDISEVVRIPHPDPAFSLRGYRVALCHANADSLKRIPISEDSGVAFFSWRKGDVVLASIEVDDFENFGVLTVGRADAESLARVCGEDQSDNQVFLAHKVEIDGLSATGNWLPLNSVLEPRTNSSLSDQKASTLGNA